MCELLNKQALEKPGDKRKMFKSAESQAGLLKGLRRASCSPGQMHANPSPGKDATALLHSPDCALNLQLSPTEPGNHMAQTSTERKPPNLHSFLSTNTAFASMSTTEGAVGKTRISV